MGHRFSSIFFTIILIGILLNKTKLKNKFDLIKTHKILGTIFIIYMIGYSIIDYIIDREAFILLIIPSLIGIYYTGKNKYKLKNKYSHLFFIILFLITLLTHVLT